jgi:hypothetical protein
MNGKRRAITPRAAPAGQADTVITGSRHDVGSQVVDIDDGSQWRDCADAVGKIPRQVGRINAWRQAGGLGHLSGDQQRETGQGNSGKTGCRPRSRALYSEYCMSLFIKYHMGAYPW